MTAFIDLLNGADIVQLEEVAGEWALEGIKAVIGEDGKGVWWIVANLVAGEIVAIEDIIAQVAKMVSKPGSGKVFCHSWMGLMSQDLSETQLFELLCQISNLICAESGTKLCLSMTVDYLHYLFVLLTTDLSIPTIGPAQNLL